MSDLPEMAEGPLPLGEMIETDLGHFGVVWERRNVEGQDGVKEDHRLLLAICGEPRRYSLHTQVTETELEQPNWREAWDPDVAYRILEEACIAIIKDAALMLELSRDRGET
jgi:hypothetical protein